jgi:hypothetical protein
MCPGEDILDEEGKPQFQYVITKMKVGEDD